ncbi:MAG: HDIG domain-containing protein [Armatimonadetes bacterium]|nr:HDIG domain-containing protein [Armatimonadota bacterium]
MHPAVALVASSLQGSALDGKAYVVGGAVRDELLGKPLTNDLDIVLEGSSEECVQLLVDAGIAESDPAVYPRFGTAMVRIAGANVELVTARKESYTPESRKPSVQPASILEDAQRRDFTINTLLRRVSDGLLLDPLGTGLPDLHARILRTPVDATRTFYDDPLRMLRAVRFRWQLGFAYAPGLFESLCEQAPRLKAISMERIRDELVKMLALPDAAGALGDLMDSTLLDQFAPEFRPMKGCEQKGFHHLDVWDHTLLALKNAGHDDLILSLAVLLHDVAKPETKSVEADGRIRFLRHETRGADMATEILTRLRFSADLIDVVALMVRRHMVFNSMPELTASAARRLLRDFGDGTERFLSLVEADASALKPGVRVLDLEPVRHVLAEVQKEAPPELYVSPLSGDEIMGMTGLNEGMQVGALKRLLTEDVLDGIVAPGDKDAAKARLMEHWRNLPPQGDVAEGEP